MAWCYSFPPRTAGCSSPQELECARSYQVRDKGSLTFRLRSSLNFLVLCADSSLDIVIERMKPLLREKRYGEAVAKAVDLIGQSGWHIGDLSTLIRSFLSLCICLLTSAAAHVTGVGACAVGFPLTDVSGGISGSGIAGHGPAARSIGDWIPIALVASVVGGLALYSARQSRYEDGRSVRPVLSNEPVFRSSLGSVGAPSLVPMAGVTRLGLTAAVRALESVPTCATLCTGSKQRNLQTPRSTSTKSRNHKRELPGGNTLQLLALYALKISNPCRYESPTWGHWRDVPFIGTLQ